MDTAFLDAIKQHDFFTENGAVSHSTTGDSLVDYFAKSGTFRDRERGEVYADVSKIFAESPMIATMIVFYNRMVTRKTKGFYNSETVQKGQGNRDEFRKAICWLAQHHPDSFYQNLWLVPVVGTWKDLWHEDTIAHLDEKKVFELVKQGIEDQYNCALIAKYLPRWRSKSKKAETRKDYHNRLNQWIHRFCKEMKWSKKDYRKFKASGSSHEFQRLMCAGEWYKIDFNQIPGKALFQIVNNRSKSDGKTILERRGMEQAYIEWIKKQPVAKFTGYVYELFKAVTYNLSIAQKLTLDRQFDQLIQMGKQDGDAGLKGNVWCALDTSGSMTWSSVDKQGTRPLDVCLGLGIYFASLNEGAFKDHVISFDRKSQVHQLKGSFVDKVLQVQRIGGMGNTNFQSVVDEIVRIRKANPDIPVEDYPETLLVVSDMQFDPSTRYGYNGFENAEPTNYEEMMRKLEAVGLPRIKVIWWWVTGRGEDFPSTIGDEGVTMIGGFDPTIVSLILGGEQEVVDKTTGQKRQLNAYENMLKALDQEVLRRIEV